MEHCYNVPIDYKHVCITFRYKWFFKNTFFYSHFNFSKNHQFSKRKHFMITVHDNRKMKQVYTKILPR